MANKKINYLARNFDDVKSELIKFSNQYYPELSDDFNDSSVGAWFVDLVSAVGDDLSYHTDRMFQETNINSANLRSTLLNMARTNGVKIPGAKSSLCEVEVSCELPVKNNQPDWDYAPILQRTSIVSAGNYNYELTEDVNFYEQFNSDGYSNRIFTPVRDSNGSIIKYKVAKRTVVVNGNTKVYKKVIYSSDLKPFMEVVLPEDNVLNIESIIFKESADITNSPAIQEYYVDSEQFRLSDSAVVTYRYFETDSLADQWRFGMETQFDHDNIVNIYNPYAYVDYTDNGTEGTTRKMRYFRGQWKPLTQKFITEYTDNGYLKIIFGAGNGYADTPSGTTTYGEYAASNLINNDMLGVLPKEGWTMFVLYRIGGGVSTNVGPGAINTLTIVNVDWGGNTGNTDGGKRGEVISSLRVTNVSTAVAGKDAPSSEEIKYLIKYNTTSQNRAVTVQDYKVKLMQMPPKYGAPFRNTVIENNNKIEMSFLGLDADGKLDSALPQTLVENTIEYMSHYKQINDYMEIRSGKIYNLGVELDLFVDKNYNPANVISNVITTVIDYFDVNKRDMGEDIFVGDLEKEISLTDGVISLIKLRIYKIYGNKYSPDICPLAEATSTPGVCETAEPANFSVDGGTSKEIDLDAIEHVLYGDYNSMYEIKNPTTDIQCRVKLK
jgi:hypothetical protein